MGKQVQKGLTPSCKPSGSSSIPVKYQTMVIRNTEREGFNCHTKRFTDKVNEHPGPGSYLSHTSAETCSPSFSKKGTGGLASKTERVRRNPQRGPPGPDAYDLQRSLVRQHDFNHGVSRTFRTPIAVTAENLLHRTPAPNQYNVSYSGVEVNSAVSAKSAFLSRTERSSIFTSTQRGPSPCHYSVNDEVLQKTPKVLSSCFKSTSSRIQPLANSEAPGPGRYNPHEAPEPAKKTILPRRHYLGLSAPATIPPKPPPLPGPGQYDIANNGPPEHHMTNAAFGSGTGRWTQESRGHETPGPGFYEPDVLTKRSFLYNHCKTWVPA